MLYLRGCGRCGGDVFVERDPGALDDLVCLQCGARRAFPVERLAERRTRRAA